MHTWELSPQDRRKIQRMAHSCHLTSDCSKIRRRLYWRNLREACLLENNEMRMDVLGLMRGHRSLTWSPLPLCDPMLGPIVIDSPMRCAEEPLLDRARCRSDGSTVDPVCTVPAEKLGAECKGPATQEFDEQISHDVPCVVCRSSCVEQHAMQECVAPSLIPSSKVGAICPDADRAAAGCAGTDAARLNSLRPNSGLASPLLKVGAWEFASMPLSGAAKGVGSCLKAVLLASCKYMHVYTSQIWQRLPS